MSTKFQKSYIFCTQFRQFSSFESFKKQVSTPAKLCKTDCSKKCNQSLSAPSPNQLLWIMETVGKVRLVCDQSIDRVYSQGPIRVGHIVQGMSNKEPEKKTHRVWNRGTGNARGSQDRRRRKCRRGWIRHCYSTFFEALLTGSPTQFSTRFWIERGIFPSCLFLRRCFLSVVQSDRLSCLSVSPRRYLPSQIIL